MLPSDRRVVNKMTHIYRHIIDVLRLLTLVGRPSDNSESAPQSAVALNQLETLR